MGKPSATRRFFIASSAFALIACARPEAPNGASPAEPASLAPMDQNPGDAPDWTDDFGPGEKPTWSDEFAHDLVGATVIVGLTYLRPNGEVESQVQMFGTITVADRQQGIAIALTGSRAGETYWLPPDQRGFAPAPPGSYRLRSTGETVEDPDYTSNWTINRPHS